MNRSIFVGNLVRDPEIRTTSGDKKVCSFMIACNRRFKNADGVREADFIPVTCWNSLAETCFKYLNKGRRVAVSGRIETSRYTKDDETRYSFSVVADEVEFVSQLPGRQKEDMEPVESEEAQELFEEDETPAPVNRQSSNEVRNFLDAMPDERPDMVAGSTSVINDKKDTGSTERLKHYNNAFKK